MNLYSRWVNEGEGLRIMVSNEASWTKPGIKYFTGEQGFEPRSATLKAAVLQVSIVLKVGDLESN